MATQCSQHTLLLQTKVWTNISCLLPLAVFAEPLREQRIGMFMQEASTSLQQDGGESRYVNGARIIPLAPEGSGSPRLGLVLTRLGTDQGQQDPRGWRAALLVPRAPAPWCPLSQSGARLVPAPRCVPAHHGHGHAVEFPIFS